MKKIIAKLLEGILNLVRKSMRRFIAWDPFYNTARKRMSRKSLVEYSMQKGAIELDGSGYKILKLERELGSSNSDFDIIIDDIKICTINKVDGKVRFSEDVIKNHYDLIEHVRRILRNLSKGGLKLNESFKEYFETKDNDDSKYDRSYESNISTHLSAVGWQIF